MKKIFSVIILIACFIAIRSFLNPNFFIVHDNVQGQRVFELSQSLKDGMIPVRWVADLGYGYGYPIFNFYAPLAYYIGGVFSLVGVDILLATKLMMVLGILLAFFSMYLLAKEIFGEYGGVISGVLYLHAPYHALDIFVRGDVAEFWAYGFIPLIFYGLLKIYREGKWKNVIITSTSFAGVILSHNLTAFMVAPFLLVVGGIGMIVLFHKREYQKLILIIVSVLLGVGLAGFYWLPVFGEMKYTNVLSQVGGTADYRDHFVCPQQLWESLWGFGGSVKGCVDGLSFRIGKLHIILSILGLGLLLWKNKKYKNELPLIVLIFGVCLVSIFLLLQVSQPVWDSLKVMAFLQYPWRFLIIITLTTSLLSGMIGTIFERNIAKIFNNKFVPYLFLAILIGVSWVLYGKLFAPQSFVQVTSSQLTDKSLIRFDISKISDEYLPPGFIKPQQKDEIPTEKVTLLSGEAQLQNSIDKTQIYQTTVSSQGPVLLGFTIAYFPAWQFTLDGKEIAFTDIKKGIVVAVPPGTHQFKAEFIQTPIETLGNILSLGSIVLLILGIIGKGRFFKKSHIYYG